MQIETEAALPLALRATGTHGAVSGVELHQLATEKVVSHRLRRAATPAQETLAPETTNAATTNVEPQLRHRRDRSSEAARAAQQAVAERYANSVSYHEFLTAEAERALQKAKLTAQAETTSPHSAPSPETFAVSHAIAEAFADIAAAATELIQEPVLQARSEPSAASPASSSLTVQLYEELGAGLPGVVTRADKLQSVVSEAQSAEANALDEEIAFRHSPQFHEFILEPVTIPANVIEFPRQLVAPRKGRPRRAEGPLLEESAPEPQLRIFEVETEQISVSPATEPVSAPEWQSMLLGAHKPAEEIAAQSMPDLHRQFTQQPQTARAQLRLLAAAVDAGCIAAAFAAFITVAAKISGPALHALPLPDAGACAAVMLLGFGVVYQLLFFSLAGSTPGMRCARIGLCTFNEAQPTRKAMRRRIIATLLAACPLGIGLAWAWMDEDRLGWHDRMSKMYLRAY